MQDSGNAPAATYYSAELLEPRTGPRRRDQHNAVFKVG